MLKLFKRKPRIPTALEILAQELGELDIDWNRLNFYANRRGGETYKTHDATVAVEEVVVDIYYRMGIKVKPRVISFPNVLEGDVAVAGLEAVRRVKSHGTYDTFPIEDKRERVMYALCVSALLASGSDEYFEA